MKNSIKILVAGLLVFAGISCTENLDYEPGGVGSVTELMTPSTGYYVELQSASTATLDFAWAPSLAEDGQNPHYEVVFYKNAQGGEPVYRVDAGYTASVAITHKEINRAAGAAGVETGADGIVYWAVVASRGVTESPVTVTPRRLELKRLLGFNVIPTELYITGEGSEGGADLSAAQKARCNAEGEFTLYTKIESGKGFTFVSSLGDDRTTYTIVNGILDDQSTTPATLGETAVYRIKLDFNIRSITLSKVNRVTYNFAPRREDNRDMTYIGNGCWKMYDYPVAFREESWGKDERYNFMPVIDGDTYIWCGSLGNDSRPGKLSGPEYDILNEVPFAGDYYNPKFKFHGDLDGKTVDITVKMSGDLEQYTHLIDNIR